MLLRLFVFSVLTDRPTLTVREKEMLPPWTKVVVVVLLCAAQASGVEACACAQAGVTRGDGTTEREKTAKPDEMERLCCLSSEILLVIKASEHYVVGLASSISCPA